MIGEDTTEEEEESFHEKEEPEITLQDLTGLDIPGTLRVYTLIRNKQMVTVVRRTIS